MTILSNWRFLVLTVAVPGLTAATILLPFLPANTIGRRVAVGESQIDCQIKSRKKVYSVGEQADISVRIVNRSERPLLLVGRRSNLRGDYPHVDLNVEGRKDGVWRTPNEHGWRRSWRCGNDRGGDLKPEDFVEVRPGEAFDPFQSAWLSRIEFLKPGTYQVSFHYNSASNDLASWTPPWDPDDRVRALLSRVPAVELQAHLTVRVVE